MGTRLGESGYLNYYEFSGYASLNCLRFEDMTEEWLDFIVKCRLGKPHNYDIVEGPMANDTIFIMFKILSMEKSAELPSGNWRGSKNQHIK